MANGKVDDLSWSQLRPRRADPLCVVDSIPPEDMQAFLRLMATNPFLPFSEALAVRSKISNLRQWRTDAANPNTITVLSNCLLIECACCELSEEHTNDWQLDLAYAAGLLHARRSFPVLSTDIRDRMTNPLVLLFWVPYATLAVFLLPLFSIGRISFHRKEFSLVKVSSKRRRELPNGSAVDGNVHVGKDSDSDDEQPRRKNRRSARPALSPLAQRAPPRSDSPQSDEAPQIGPEFQAEVPEAPLSKEEMDTYWKGHPCDVLSRIVYSEESLGGSQRVDTFLNDLNSKIRRRHGFPLGPYALEKALKALFHFRGNQSVAIKKLVKAIPPGPFFPGINGKFAYEEQCMFVRSLAERSKDFRQISLDVLPNRSTSELIWLYYTRHKQLWIQNGGLKNGLVLDDGGEKLKRVQLTTERTISALRNLAVTAGDGFPIDSRVNLAVLACRRGNVQHQKNIRDEEALRRVPRLRNQNVPS